MQIRKGFTLVELLIAVAITSAVGLSVSALTYGLSKAYGDREVDYRVLQTARAASMRLESEIRRATLVVGADEHNLILWGQDTNENDKINLSELVVVYWDSRQRRLTRHAVDLESLDPRWRKLFDTTGTLMTVISNTRTVSSLVRGSYWSTSSIIGQDIEDFSVGLDPPLPETKVVSVKLTIGGGNTPVYVEAVAKVRADKTDRLQLGDRGKWELLEGSDHRDDDDD